MLLWNKLIFLCFAPTTCFTDFTDALVWRRLAWPVPTPAPNDRGTPSQHRPVIREFVVVVELERAPLSGAVGWATFSGTGTYTLYVHRGNVEEVVFSGRFSRAGRISPGTYMEALQQYGWHRKVPGSGM